MKKRIEKDSLGERELPKAVYYGIQTSRAVDNFPISGLRSHPELIRAIGLVKRAAAETNMLLGELDQNIGAAIVQAAEEVSQGRWNDQFVVDVFQAGAGTSFNMNANEVIANRALEILGVVRGDYSSIHPNDHVNRGQSTNDVYPSCLRLAAVVLTQELIAELDSMIAVLELKAEQFCDVVKPGRTHLQDAVPIRLGQEFAGYALAIRHGVERLQGAQTSLERLGLGGTAVGTGFSDHPRFHSMVVNRIRELSNADLRSASSLIESIQSMDDFAETSSALKLLALDLIRMANDLRLMSSGPNTGLREINLPAVQPGSSIMPGKVNPVMAEMLNMVCFQVIGNDSAIAIACQAGQFEINVMTPVIAFNLLQSLDIMDNGIKAFKEKCLVGITANEEHCRYLAERSLGLATVLSRCIGYDETAEIAKESLATGRSVKDIAVDRGVLSKKLADELFDPANLTKPFVISCKPEE
ncbi:MAG: aspartate ammonia-lyase [Chloroflexota bacterium]|nr:aspartate ammonia-lyase [Chloroflexota bacterium]